MTTEATVTFVIPERFEKALRLVRRSLTDEAISIVMELDISGRIHRGLGVDLGPCRILCVDSPLLLLQAMTLDASTVAFLPLHVAVSADGQRTVVHLLSQSGIQGCASPLGAKSVVSKFQAGLSRALEKIALKQGPAHVNCKFESVRE